MLDFKQIDSDGDIDLTSGDIQLVDPTRQHQRDIIMTSKGELKCNPLTGVGVESYFNDESPEDLMREIRKECIKDGMTFESIAIVEGQIVIKAVY